MKRTLTLGVIIGFIYFGAMLTLDILLITPQSMDITALLHAPVLWLLISATPDSMPLGPWVFYVAMLAMDVVLAAVLVGLILKIKKRMVDKGSLS